jgi:phosphotransferase system enzyme I (PtsI)
MRGEPVSNGISHGVAFLMDTEIKIINRSITADQIAQEIVRFREGRDAAAIELQKLIEIGDDKADIFEGHLEILTSEDLDAEIVEIINEQKISAEEAARIFAESNAREMEELDDPYFRERGQDFRDIGRQLIQEISGTGNQTIDLPEDAVVVSNELSPSQTAALNLSRVRGFIFHKGGINCHAAIIARSLEVPAVILRDTDLFNAIKDGDSIYMDGFTGEIWISPDEAVINELKVKERKNQQDQNELLKLIDLPSETLDHRKIGLYANVGGLHDIQSAKKYRADGIGLFRTEFLFMETMSCPDATRQADVYRSAIEAMNGQPVLIRLLDTGADKPLPYWSLPPEDNPFLGIRGIRLLFEKEDVLRTQIRAFLAASTAGPVGMMIPMVAALRSIHQVKALIEEEKAALNRKGPDTIRLGVMIETPAAVQLIDEILDIVDFISIGTNDLTQYLLAADRGNSSMHSYYDEFHPAVFRSIAHVIRHAKKKEKLNGICGELAGKILAVPFFTGLGVDELSINPSQIPEIKHLIRHIDAREAGMLVDEVLRIPTSEGIRARLTRFLTEKALMK